MFWSTSCNWPGNALLILHNHLPVCWSVRPVRSIWYYRSELKMHPWWGLHPAVVRELARLVHISSYVDGSFIFLVGLTKSDRLIVLCMFWMIRMLDNSTDCILWYCIVHRGHALCLFDFGSNCVSSSFFGPPFDFSLFMFHRFMTHYVDVLYNIESLTHSYLWNWAANFAYNVSRVELCNSYTCRLTVFKFY